MTGDLLCNYKKCGNCNYYYEFPINFFRTLICCIHIFITVKRKLNGTALSEIYTELQKL